VKVKGFGKMFKGKVVVVTGSSSGIGAGTAIRYAKEGAAVVVIHGRRQEQLEKVKKDCEAASHGQGKVHVVIGDISDPKIQDKLINETVKLFGQLDVLVNNAGISMEATPTATCPIDVFDNIFNINVRSLILTSQLAIPHLVKTKGNIVNISSVAAIKAHPVFTYYNMSKISVDHFTRCLAVELGPQGVRVNSVQPGAIPDTDLASRSLAKAPDFEQFVKIINERTPMRRPGGVDEVANTILFLSSDCASFITGTCTTVDGGLYLS
jgi:NAD(P)-dependent dehydrogenase (short-subunit alcohol dehydrogenase family)